MSSFILQTGLRQCFDSRGEMISCLDSGQDAEFAVREKSVQSRFKKEGAGLIRDENTGLIWDRNADVLDFPITWTESLELIVSLNKNRHLGRMDWRIPDRRELRSLIDHGQRMPAMPPGHPFSGIRASWYWTGTSSAMFPEYAWYIHFAGGRMFWGRKNQLAFCRPVCGKSGTILHTGQSGCIDENGKRVGCRGIYSLADGCFPPSWEGRFQDVDYGIKDVLTGLVWYKSHLLNGRGIKWQEALDSVRGFNEKDDIQWRLPNINELESLVDCSRHTPALPKHFSLGNAAEVYWSSTTSGYETDWAYALYMHKGAVGVGHKESAEYAVWPVSE